MSLAASQYLQDFPDELGGDMNERDLLILHNHAMCRYLEDLHNFVGQYFPNDQCLMLQNHAWVADPVTAPDGPMDLM